MAYTTFPVSTANLFTGIWCTSCVVHLNELFYFVWWWYNHPSESAHSDSDEAELR